jgi:hypothetical protein
MAGVRKRLKRTFRIPVGKQLDRALSTLAATGRAHHHAQRFVQREFVHRARGRTRQEREELRELRRNLLGLENSVIRT